MTARVESALANNDQQLPQDCAGSQALQQIVLAGQGALLRLACVLTLVACHLVGVFLPRRTTSR